MELLSVSQKQFIVPEINQMSMKGTSGKLLLLSVMNASINARIGRAIRWLGRSFESKLFKYNSSTEEKKWKP